MAEGSAGAGTVRGNVTAIVAGLAVLALGMLAVRDGAVSGVEEAWFRAANDLPEWMYPAVMPLQQLGALLLGPVVALVALLLRRYRLAIAACLVTLLKLRQRARRQGRRQPRAPGHLDRLGRRAAWRRAHRRRELRLRTRRARRRSGRRDHAVPPRAVEGRAVGSRRRGDVRTGVRRRPQPARRRLWRRPRHRHRRRGQPADVDPLASRRRSARRARPTRQIRRTSRRPSGVSQRSGSSRSLPLRSWRSRPAREGSSSATDVRAHR